MKLDRIRGYVHAAPFRPVEFLLTSGDHAVLGHPEQFAMSPDGFIVVIDIEPNGKTWMFWANEISAMRVPKFKPRQGNHRARGPRSAR